jgi:hypothetical protein
MQKNEMSTLNEFLFLQWVLWLPLVAMVLHANEPMQEIFGDKTFLCMQDSISPPVLRRKVGVHEQFNTFWVGEEIHVSTNVMLPIVLVDQASGCQRFFKFVVLLFGEIFSILQEPFQRMPKHSKIEILLCLDVVAMCLPGQNVLVVPLWEFAVNAHQDATEQDVV